MAFRIPLDLTKHCVETEIKRLYDQAISDCFNPSADVERAEEIVEIAQQVLKSADFAQLRTKYPPLAGQTHCRVMLSADGGTFAVWLSGKAILRIAR